MYFTQPNSKNRITCFRMLQLLLVCFLFAKTGFATEYGRAMANPGKGEIVPLDITLDKKTMLIYPGQPQPPQECFTQSLNLHDFERHLVAIKVVDKGVCWIKQSSETYEEVHALLNELNAGGNPVVNQTTEEWAVPDREVSPEQLVATVGPRIANFCSGYKVYVMQNGHVVREAVDAESDIKRKLFGKIKIKIGCFLCFRCSVVMKSS